MKKWIAVAILALTIPSLAQQINPTQVRGTAVVQNPAGPQTVNQLSDPTTAMQASNKQYSDASGGVWRRQGTIMTGNSGEQWSVQEPSVMYENGTFEMWFTCGWDIENLCYATSTDGINWTRYTPTTPMITNVAHGFVMKQGSTYYYYAAILPASNNFGRWHSSDKVTWVQDSSTILPSAGTGWEAGQRGNIYVWIEGSTWKALYEALGSDTVWRTGLATSSDGVNWTKYSGNPTIEFGPNGTCGGPEVHNVSGVYYVWEQCSPMSFEPSDIYRLQSTDLHTFTRSPSWPVLARTTPDEGPGLFDGQVADASMVEVNGSTYMFYDATNTQSPSPVSGIHLNLAIAPMTIAQLVKTTEGSKDTNGMAGNIVDGPYGFFGPQYNNESSGYIPHVPPAGRSFDIGVVSLLGVERAPSIGLGCYWDGSIWRFSEDGDCSVLSINPNIGTTTLVGTPVGGPKGTAATLSPGLMIDNNGNVTIPANTNMQSLTVAQKLINAPGFQVTGGPVGCTTAAIAGSSCTSAPLPWTAPFADSNYFAICSIDSPTGAPVIAVQTKSPGSFTVSITATTAVATTGFYNCIGIHN